MRKITKLPVTNFQAKKWSKAMKDSGLDTQDPALYAYMIDGLSEGCSTHRDMKAPLRSNTANLPTAAPDNAALTRWLVDGFRETWALGPFSEEEIEADPDDLKETHVNPIGCVPKPASLVGIRPIVDMSSPHDDENVNDGIPTEFRHPST
jgi:hypothetical protein